MKIYILFASLFSVSKDELLDWWIKCKIKEINYLSSWFNFNICPLLFEIKCLKKQDMRGGPSPVLKQCDGRVFSANILLCSFLTPFISVSFGKN
jgi:hypothetical protein